MLQACLRLKEKNETLTREELFKWVEYLFRALKIIRHLNLILFLLIMASWRHEGCRSSCLTSVLLLLLLLHSSHGTHTRMNTHKHTATNTTRKIHVSLSLFFEERIYFQCMSKDNRNFDKRLILGKCTQSPRWQLVREIAGWSPPHTTHPHIHTPTLAPTITPTPHPNPHPHSHRHPHPPTHTSDTRQPPHTKLSTVVLEPLLPLFPVILRCSYLIVDARSIIELTRHLLVR